MTQDDSLEYPDTLEAAAEALRSLSNGAGDARVRSEHVLYVAAGLGDTEPRRLSEFIREHLLPGCLREPTSGDVRDEMQSSRLRKLLSDWLDSLPEETLWPVRRDILRDLLEALDRAPSSAALYCLSTIGYRSDETVQAFRKIGLRDDSLGHVALRLLVGLQPSRTDLTWVSERIAQTPPAARSDELLTAVAQLHDQRWLGLLASEALKSPNLLSGLSRIAWLGEDAPGDRKLQDRVWAALQRVAKARPDGWTTLLFTGGIVGRCNTPNVIASLVNALELVQHQGSVHVWRWADRVREAESPIQLKGWTETTVDVAQVLRPYIEQNSGPESVGQTAEGAVKDSALDALLCSGSVAAVSMLEPALRNETNSYTKALAMNRLAVLSLPVVPEEVVEILKKTPAFESGVRSQPRMHLFFAAATLAASSAEIDSLKLLLESNATMDGHPFRAPVEAAARLAVWLSEHGRTDVVPLLLRAAGSSSSMAQSVSVRFLALISHTELPLEAKQLLRAIAIDDSRQWYIRREALDALLSAGSGDSELVELLAQLASSPEPNLRRAAISALIRAGLLEAQRERIESFALRRSEASESTIPSDDVANVLGQLAAVDPDRYGGATADAIRRGNDWTRHSVLVGFRQAAVDTQRLAPVVVEALIERMRRDETPHASNPPAFFDLALVSPERLLSEDWETMWERWMPDSRKALAESLPIAVSRAPAAAASALDVLRKLAGDGTFAVRRSAARALAHLEVSELRRWCFEALASGSTKLRTLGAEAACWLPPDSSVSMDNDLLRSALRDEEHLVREAARRSRTALRHRQWATELIRHIGMPRPDANDWALSCYAFGRALERVGDDSDLAVLERMVVDREVPPSVRYWMKVISEQLSEQWKKTTDGWPDSWLPWQGAVEDSEGTIRAGGQAFDATLSLWLRRGRTLDDTSGWGAVARVKGDPYGSLFNAIHDEDASLEVQGRAPARVAIVQVSGNRLVLMGNGPYPDRYQRNSDSWS
jgi:HEAT repeat protein